MSLTRRQLLGSTAATVAGGVAGCIGSPTSTSGETEQEGIAAFLALEDWSNQVGGEAFSFESPVEVGEMGHGWDPDGNLVSTVASSTAFVYLDTPEFQWSVDIADELSNDSSDVEIIDAMQAISTNDLLSFDAVDHDREPDRDVEWDPDAFSIAEFDLIYAGDVIAWWHEGHWHGGVPDVPLNDELILTAHVTDDRGYRPPIGTDEPFQLTARFADGAPTDVLSIESRGDAVSLTGEDLQSTLVIFELRYEGDVVFDTESDPANVSVAEPDTIEIDAFHDPHVWVDPVHAQSIVDYLATSLSDIDPDNSDKYEANAAEYVSRLEEVDNAFEELASNAELDVAVFAGHDAFQYLEHRYGFLLLTPVGVTPDAVESLADVANLAAAIDEHGIDTVLYDPFESPDPDNEYPQAVEVLLENSDAEEAMPLSAAEGSTPDWQSAGYGWVEQMEEINLPALRAALKSE